MRLMIDLQGAQSASRFRGIGRYTLALVDQLLAQSAGHEVLLLINGALPDAADALIRRFASVLPRQQMVVFTPLSGVAWCEPGNGERARLMEPVREAVIAEHAPDVLLLTSLFEGYHDDAVASLPEPGHGVPTAVIHYDLIPALAPGYLEQPAQRAFYERKLAQLARADRLLAISEFSRTEALSTLGLDAHRVVNISAAVGPEFSAQRDDLSAGSEASAVLTALGIAGAFVLYVPGGFDPRKNFERLIAAYAQLPSAVRQAHCLVIPGKLDEGRAARLMSCAAKAGLAAGELLLPGYVSDEQLRCLYGHAALFVFPSLHEGFGLPVLEAMACGAPVIAANASSMPEVVGEPAALFDPHSEADMCRALLRGLNDTDFRAALVAAAHRQATRFSWSRTAERALTALEALHAERAARAAAPLNGPSSLPGQLRAVYGEPLPEDLIAVLATCLARHFGSAAQSQFLLDVTELMRTDGKSGIQRVVRSLLLAFWGQPPAGFHISAIYFDGAGFRHARQFLAEFAGAASGADDKVDWRPGDVYLSLDLNIRSMPDTEPLMRDLARRGIRLCFVVFDLLPILRPDWWPEGMGPRFEEWLRRLVGVADTVCCISHAVATELEGWLDQAAPPVQYRRPAVCWFHLGADVESSAPSGGWPENYPTMVSAAASRPTLLMVGTLEPRKGYAQALAAFEALWSDGHDINLMVVGKPGWLVEGLMAQIEAHPENGTRLYWLSGASDECLDDLYGRATALLVASEAEGFGLPLIEAARHGLPIICRDLPVFREVAGDAAHYFAGHAGSDLSVSIARWLALKAEGKAPDAGRLTWLTWQQSATQLLGALGLAGDDADQRDTR